MSSAPFRPASVTSAADPRRPTSDAAPVRTTRLDAELVRRRLARSRGEARELVVGGHVRVSGAPATKPAQPVSAGVEILLDRPGPAWVGRGAEKLLGALERWAPAGLDVAGRRCVDVGASTGGFTQVLLARGAATVIAVDVGRGQLAADLAVDPRVEERSGTTVRGLTAADLGGRADLVVADLSFISLRLVLADLAALVAPAGDVITLVKPQFEVGRARLGKGGVVTDADARRAAIVDVAAAGRAAGLHPYAVMASPVRGAEGNVEYLVWFRPEPSGKMGEDAVAAAARTLTKGPA